MLILLCDSYNKETTVMMMKKKKKKKEARNSIHEKRQTQDESF